MVKLGISLRQITELHFRTDFAKLNVNCQSVNAQAATFHVRLRVPCQMEPATTDCKLHCQIEPATTDCKLHCQRGPARRECQTQACMDRLHLQSATFHVRLHVPCQMEPATTDCKLHCQRGLARRDCKTQACMDRLL